MKKLIIKGRLTDLNTYIKLCKQQKGAYSPANDKKQEEQFLIRMYAKQQKIQPIKSYPVRFTFAWYDADERRDIDNVAFAKKFILDALQEAGILAKDSRKYVTGFQDKFYVDRTNPRVEVFIYQDINYLNEIKE
ncbi:MAG: hypothetical protein LBN22_11590 [Clostridiales Family XIII bacterium]|jgi:Holliday junction resolvase RusA-like endonuclease|nr:hypothetical protein [Clostridiales Family XIII bacterium]